MRSSKLWQSDALLPDLCNMQSKNEFPIFLCAGVNAGLLHCMVHSQHTPITQLYPSHVLVWLERRRMRFHDKWKLHEIQNLPGHPDITLSFTPQIQLASYCNFSYYSSHQNPGCSISSKPLFEGIEICGAQWWSTCLAHAGQWVSFLGPGKIQTWLWTLVAAQSISLKTT